MNKLWAIGMALLMIGVASARPAPQIEPICDEASQYTTIIINVQRIYCSTCAEIPVFCDNYVVGFVPQEYGQHTLIRYWQGTSVSRFCAPGHTVSIWKGLPYERSTIIRSMCHPYAYIVQS